MTNVFVITAGWLYEGFNILAVFADEYEAITFYGDVMGGYDWKKIEKWDITTLDDVRNNRVGKHETIREHV